MSERVDHVAEARHELVFADSQFPEMNRAPGGVAFERALVSAVQAQVHATLALVEQQQIANVIELAKGAAGAEAQQAARSALVVQTLDGFSSAASVRPEVREALGL